MQAGREIEGAWLYLWLFFDVEANKLQHQLSSS